jgi:hypothetical protein
MLVSLIGSSLTSDRVACFFDAPHFLGLREGEVRLVPGRLGENFSGSCIVTSRNPLIHIGATTATKSWRFHPKGVLQGLLLRD